MLRIETGQRHRVIPYQKGRLFQSSPRAQAAVRAFAPSSSDTACRAVGAPSFVSSGQSHGSASCQPLPYSARFSADHHGYASRPAPLSTFGLRLYRSKLTPVGRNLPVLKMNSVLGLLHWATSEPPACPQDPTCTFAWWAF